MERILTVTSYGEDATEYRVTINSMNVSYVVADAKMELRASMNLHKVYVKFIEEGSMTIYIDGNDLRNLEAGIGTYGFDD